jgi:penicillin-binding protein-related factor A (putative recombinase)
MDGKALEKLLQESCKIQDIDCTRLRDAGWQGEQTQRRFTVKNICDFIVFGDGTLVYIECKSSKDRLALSRLTQQKDLLSKAASTAQNIFCGYLVWIAGEFVFIRAGAVDQFTSTGKKSINKTDAMRLGTVIQQFTPPRARKPRLDIKELIYELNHPF